MVVDLPAALPPRSSDNLALAHVQADAFQDADRTVISDDFLQLQQNAHTPPNRCLPRPNTFRFSATSEAP